LGRPRGHQEGYLRRRRDLIHNTDAAGSGRSMAASRCRFGATALMSEMGLGCVKTRTSRECAELFSLFLLSTVTARAVLLLFQRNRDKLSTRKFDVGVFTQPGSFPDLGARNRDVRFTQISRHRRLDHLRPLSANKRLMHRSKGYCYSITSSARPSRVAGSSRPRALAVLRLTTSSYLVGACTGRSAGFSPLRMRST
jgi:hypothetical protein